MSVKIGISPIAWQNDDLPDLTAKFTMEQALREAREIGYAGIERGQRMPPETGALRVFLEKYDIALCGGWCSGNLLVNDLASEKEAVRQQVAQFAALNAPCIVYAECSNTIQGDIDTPVNNRPKLDRDEARAYARKLGELAKWTEGEGMPLAYHPHMGSCIEDETDIDRLMEFSPPEVHLLYDTGHIRFGGGDVIGVFRKWRDRVLHVHFKDVRAEIVRDVRENARSFLDAVIAGAFTVPGDGTPGEGGIDFQVVANELGAADYAGWIVVEAEQDPAKAPPRAYSQMGYAHTLEVCTRAGLTVDVPA